MKIALMKFAFLCLIGTHSFFSIAQITDGDGNVYDTVVIGTQVWLSSSLKTTHFLNGDAIPTTSPSTLNVNGEPAPLYQWAYNGTDSLADIYGRLYTWYAIADERKVCPSGYHVPSSQEFQTLIAYLGGPSVAGGKLKETGIEHWNSPNAGATNEYGFSGVANGNRNLLGYFNDMGLVSDMWSTTEGTLGAWDCDLHAGNAGATSNDDPKGFAFAVRCVKDQPDASVSSDEISESVSVYPNPAREQLTVDAKNLSFTGYRVVSLNGTSLLEGLLNPGLNSIDIQSLAPGVYLIQLIGDDQWGQVKFVKEP